MSNADHLELFISKLERELDMLEPGSLKPEVKYRDIPNWSSMYALIIVAFCETEYNVAVTGEDLRKCETVTDLHELVQSRTGSS
jgi:acyl carrier protein